jgi:hypothetical protein
VTGETMGSESCPGDPGRLEGGEAWCAEMFLATGDSGQDADEADT